MESKMAVRNILVGTGVERLRNRASWVFRDGICIGGVKTHIQRLAVNLERIQALLPDAEKKGAASEIVRSWLQRVAAVSSETDILLDECCVQNLRSKLEAERRKPRKVLTFLVLNNVAARAKLVWRAKGINSKFERLFCESFVFGISPAKIGVLSNPEFEEVTSEASRMESLRMREDFSKIKDWLLDARQGLGLFGIIGKEGVEKTNLTRSLYEDAGVMNHFDQRIWIDVSPEFQIMDILKAMSEWLHVSGESNQEACEGILVEKFRDRSFLLVLNNVVLRDKDVSKWSTLMGALRRIGGLTSKRNALLVTATTSNVTDDVFPWNHKLTDKQSEERDTLFGESAFSEDGILIVPRIMKLSKEIMERCRGRHRLGRLMDMLMYSRKYDSEWQKTAQDEVFQVVDVPEEELLDNMELSYDHLPSLLLKQCFALCCLFPRDVPIHKEELVQLWRAHGLLDPPKGSCLNREKEDRGARCLNILSLHSFLEESGDNFPHKSCCNMSGLVHDLATLISNGTCSVMEGIDVKDDFKAVHVTMINCTLELSENLRDTFEKLRTLRLVDTGILSDILPYTKHLAALTVVGSGVEELPDSIGKLQYLKLLDVSKTRIVKLPDSITDLCGLEALRLYDLVKPPKNFENLVSLSHLYIESENFETSGVLKLLPSRYYKLIKQSSFKVSFKACLSNQFGIENLASLEHPGRYSSLKIYRLEKVKNKEEATRANLSRMERIEYLKLHWSGRRENNYDENVLEGLKPHTNIRHFSLENFKGATFPYWMVATSHPLVLENLVTIEFQGCCWCERVPPLGHLPYLQEVKIQGMDNVKHISGEFYGSLVSGAVFPVLRHLSLLGMASLEHWSGLKDRSAFPVLEKLEVERCPKLTSLPDIFNGEENRLQRLQIAFCDSITDIPESLRNLKFLDDLEIRGLPMLSMLSMLSTECYRNLTRLTIGDLCNVDSIAHKGLPAELERFSNLQLRYLAIWGYDELKDLPDSVVGFESLQTLKVEFCKKLMYFPSAEKMQKLTKLNEISISFCPLLEERCIRGSRPEWHKISHIRRIVINYEDMK